MLTINSIKSYLQVANDIMIENIVEYKPINFTNIKISKARTFLGKICRKKNKITGNFDYSLRISGPIFESFKIEEAMEKQLISTLIHELIHTCPYCFNHGYEFKKNCHIINFNTNNKYHVSTREDLQSNEEFNYDKLDELKPRRKAKAIPHFEIYCPDCNKIVARRYKECGLVKYVWNYRCKCGGEHLQVLKTNK